MAVRLMHLEQASLAASYNDDCDNLRHATIQLPPSRDNIWGYSLCTARSIASVTQRTVKVAHGVEWHGPTPVLLAGTTTVTQPQPSADR